MYSGSPPRRRGARSARTSVDGSECGSPPRRRGARRLPARPGRPGRITPASAGEHREIADLSESGIGSPPRRRGAPALLLEEVGHVRITPASAGSTACPAGCPGSAADHPRVGGEHEDPILFKTVHDGSPPRRRGAHQHADGALAALRITPASAGSTTGPPPLRSPCTDHPRVGGEHGADVDQAEAADGSPPRRRGARAADRAAEADQRITPASAGSTSHGTPRIYPYADHPRVGGEHAEPMAGNSARIGSPPRRRGARARRGARRWCRRITPASAGSTPTWAASCPSPTDHPRVGGEHVTHPAQRLSEAGSPPRRRGAHLRRSPAGRPRRITPASAGSTCRRGLAARQWTDHPRVGGEHTGYITPGAYAVGSPPRRRGARHRRQEQPHGGRITPASAGSTRTAGTGPGATTDHPRVGGEHRVAAGPAAASSGSPPRRRGALQLQCGGTGRARITPASAGSTRDRTLCGSRRPDHPRVGGEHRPRTSSRPSLAGSPPRRRGALPQADPGDTEPRIVGNG